MPLVSTLLSSPMSPGSQAQYLIGPALGSAANMVEHYHYFVSQIVDAVKTEYFLSLILIESKYGLAVLNKLL